MSLLGMAGIAEADLGVTWLVMWAGVLLTLAAALVGIVLGSRVAALAGAGVWGLLTLWSEPWRDFWPVPSNDPDLLPKQGRFRRLAWWWVGSSVSIALAAVRSFRKWQAEPGAAPGPAT